MTAEAQPSQSLASAKRHETPSAVQTPDAPARPEGLQLGKRLTEYFSIVTAASFALSILANQAVFDRWGLNFLQLATVADVVMSGLSLLFFTIPLALALLAAWIVGGLRGRLRWFARIALIIATLIFALGLWGLSQGEADQGAAAAVSSSGFVLVGLLGQTALRFRKARNLRTVSATIAAALIAAVTLAQTIAYTVQRYEVRGYSGDAQLYLQSATPDCKGRALWTGEHAVVLDCGAPTGPRNIRIIFGQQDRLYSAVVPPIAR